MICALEVNNYRRIIDVLIGKHRISYCQGLDAMLAMTVTSKCLPECNSVSLSACSSCMVSSSKMALHNYLVDLIQPDTISSKQLAQDQGPSLLDFRLRFRQRRSKQGLSQSNGEHVLIYSKPGHVDHHHRTLGYDWAG